jgi:peptidoglycan/LPS O-acetylase OafA/YrhL
MCVTAALFGVNFTNAGDMLGHDGKGWLTRYSAQALTGGYFAVDTFFFLSAFLAVYLMMEQVHKMTQAKGQPWSFVLKAPYIYVMRFVRLTPAYFYVILMYVWKDARHYL